MRTSKDVAASFSALQPIVLTLNLALQVAPLFLLFVLLNWWVMHVARLPEVSYQHASIALEVGKQIGALQLVALALVGLFMWHWGRLGGSWQELENGNQWRTLILLIVSILAWTYATYDYNLYFNNSHISIPSPMREKK